MQMDCGRASAFSGPVRLMQRPELVQRTEDDDGGARGCRGVVRGRRRRGGKGGNEKDPVPIYKRMDTRHARESRRPKSSCGYMDASIFGMFIKR